MHRTKRRDFTDEVRSPNVDPSGSSASGTTVLLRYFNCFLYPALLTNCRIFAAKKYEWKVEEASVRETRTQKVVKSLRSEIVGPFLSCAVEDKLVKRVCLGKESLVEGCSCFLGVASWPEHAVLCEGSSLRRRRRCPVPTVGMET